MARSRTQAFAASARRLVTPRVRVPVETALMYSHLSWDIDGQIGTLATGSHAALAADDCAALAGCALDAATGVCQCGYMPNRVYTQHICLTYRGRRPNPDGSSSALRGGYVHGPPFESLRARPGTHELHLNDAMGFGWFGSRLSLAHAPSGSLLVRNATIASPERCRAQACAIGEPSSCYERLFSPWWPSAAISSTVENCTALANTAGASCECASCCIDREDEIELWQRAVPAFTGPDAWRWPEGAQLTHTITFDVLPDPTAWAPVPLRTPAVEVVQSVNGVPCTQNGLNDATIRGLSMAQVSDFPPLSLAPSLRLTHVRNS